VPASVYSAAARRAPVGTNSPLRLLGASFLHPFHSDAVLTEQISFYRRLSILLKGGIPLYQALSSLAERAASGAIRAVLHDCQAAVERGESFSSALARHPDVVSSTQWEMIRAAEQMGRLDNTLGQAADYLEREQELRRLLRRWTLYSKITLAAGLFIIPVFTAFMMGGSIWGAISGPLFSLIQLWLLFCIVYAVVRTAAMHSPAFAEAYERAKWALPGVGGVARRYALVRFGRAFGALHAAGVNMGTALRTAGRASGSFILSGAAEVAARSAEEGQPPSAALRSSHAFPPLAVDMLQTGEESGRTDEMMQKMAEYVEDEASVRSQIVAFVFSQVIYLLVALTLVGRLVGMLGAIFHL
jgi:type II secretory pathway component PulF